MVIGRYATHKHPRVQRWLAHHLRFQCILRLPLVVVEDGGTFFRERTDNRRLAAYSVASRNLLTLSIYIDCHD